MHESAVRRPHGRATSTTTDAAAPSVAATAPDVPPDGADEPTNAELRMLLLAVGEKLDRLLAHEASHTEAHAASEPTPAASDARAGKGWAYHVRAHVAEPRAGAESQRAIDAAEVITFRARASTASAGDAKPAAEAGVQGAEALTSPAPSPGSLEAPASPASVLAKPPRTTEGAAPSAEAQRSEVDDRLRDVRERMERRRAAVEGTGAAAERDPGRVADARPPTPTAAPRPHRARWDGRQVVRLLVVVAVSVLAGLLIV